jgi:hypothetical protein
MRPPALCRGPLVLGFDPHPDSQGGRRVLDPAPGLSGQHYAESARPGAGGWVERQAGSPPRQASGAPAKMPGLDESGLSAPRAEGGFRRRGDFNYPTEQALREGMKSQPNQPGGRPNVPLTRTNLRGDLPSSGLSGHRGAGRFAGWPQPPPALEAPGLHPRHGGTPGLLGRVRLVLGRGAIMAPRR